MPSVRAVANHAGNLVRSRVPWLEDPVNPQSSLPYVPRRPSVKPILPVRDMQASIAFYRLVGFSVDTYDAGYAWVRTCGWEFFHLAAVPTLAASGSNAAAYVHVDDVDAWHRAMITNAPDVQVVDVVDQPWGMREFSVTDPDRNVLRIGQSV